MYPDDRVLVGVINRKRDLKFMQDDAWYRIPQMRMPHGVYTEYLAFFLSGAAAKPFDVPGVHFYARQTGVELAYRRDLIPQQADHARADDVYYKVQLVDIRPKMPPITNPTKRSISFIFTTWDRFSKATVIADLYGDADDYVDRIYHALRDRNVRVRRYWDAQKKETGRGAHLRVLCDNGLLVASPDENDDEESLYLDASRPDDDILAEIQTRIRGHGGPIMLSIPPNR